MSDRSTSRRITLIIGVVAGLLLLIAAYSIVFEGCQEPDTRGDVISPPDDTPTAVE